VARKIIRKSDAILRRDVVVTLQQVPGKHRGMEVSHVRFATCVLDWSFFYRKKWRTRGDDLGSFLSECVAQTAQAQNLTTDLGVVSTNDQEESVSVEKRGGP